MRKFNLPASEQDVRLKNIIFLKFKNWIITKVYKNNIKNQTK